MIKNIAWVPCNSGLAENRLFDLAAVRDRAIERFVLAKGLLEENSFCCKTIDLCDLEQVDIVIFNGIAADTKWLLKAVRANPKVKLINIPIEPPIVSPLNEQKILAQMPFDRNLVWSDELAKGGGSFYKANIGEPVISPSTIPSVPIADKNFVVAIYSSKLIKHACGLYEERMKAFDYFSKEKGGLSLYGMGWVDSKRPSVISSYVGGCKSKKDTLKNYKFSIAFENSEYNGYISEKIFDCFAAGTIPIYLGAPDVLEYIPSNCFINFRDFTNYEDLHRYLVNMDVGVYQGYLDAAKDFVATPEYYRFTSRHYAETILDQVKALAEQKVVRSVFGLKLDILKGVFSRPIYIIKNFTRCKRFFFDLLIIW